MMTLRPCDFDFCFLVEMLWRLCLQPIPRGAKFAIDGPNAMSKIPERVIVGSSSSGSPTESSKNGSAHHKSSTSQGRVNGETSTSNDKAEANGLPVDADRKENHPRVGVLPLVDGALEVGDDGRAIIWLDIDNTLYSKGSQIHVLMTERIRKYIIGLGLGEEEAERLHQKYYKEYGLAIRGLVMHHKIDALDYDSKCDATLPLETVLKPNEEHKAMLSSLDRSKCRVWALTNAYKTVSLALKDLKYYR
jgi:pyrimidine and pyridine-specific 5'-nucleotidase